VLYIRAQKVCVLYCNISFLLFFICYMIYVAISSSDRKLHVIIVDNKKPLYYLPVNYWVILACIRKTAFYC
jgi:hypothetical protein